MKKLALVTALIASFSATAFAQTSPTSTTTTTASTATINITLEKKSFLLASGTITPATTPSDRLAVKWTSPNNMNAGSCHNSTYKIKTASTHFKSKRTPWYQESNGAPVGCEGMWSASVVDLTTGKVLATTSYALSL
ncbi:MAG: hypothetical protein NTV32_09185, partial [Gammaproteobacteria bacterium]|nr:hypothetical protein [Gammaproteobacteria bacterium]